MATAKAAADQQAQLAAREAAAAKAEDIASAPLETAEVQVAGSEANANTIRRRRRATFGTGYATGVQI